MDLQQYIINAAISEIQLKSFGITEQYLEIHDVVRIDDIPEVARVDMNGENNTAIVYFPIKGVKFYLAIYTALISISKPLKEWLILNYPFNFINGYRAIL